MGQEPNGKAAENGKRTERKIPFYETKLHDIGNVFLTRTVPPCEVEGRPGFQANQAPD